MKGRGGIGSKKHGVSGRTSKSPRTRLMIKMEAEKKLKRAKPSSCVCESIQELMKQK